MDAGKRKPQPAQGPKSKRSRNDFDDADPSSFEAELAMLDQVESDLSQDGEFTAPTLQSGM